MQNSNKEPTQSNIPPATAPDATQSATKPQSTNPIPAFLLKHLKVTDSAKKRMADFEGDRVCSLDAKSDGRVFVYDARRGVDENDVPRNRDVNEMNWTQKKLVEAAKNDAHLRISRKAITSTRVEIFQRDLFQGAELAYYQDLPNMLASLADVKIGFFQSRKHDYIYILSSK